MSSDEPDGQLGLAQINLTHQPTFKTAFSTLAQPISDYSFANVFIWSAALKLYHAQLHSHLCVFANGTGDLTLLLPPIPQPGATAADLRRCLEEVFNILDSYNAPRLGLGRSRIEYVSDEQLERINAVTDQSLRLSAAPMSGDFLYPVGNMIDLPGGALKSKRHGKTRFMRDYPDHRTETFGPQHADACMELLNRWKAYADEAHQGQVTEDESHVGTDILRNREYAACNNAIRFSRELGLTGMVLYVGDKLAGFTFGEAISPAQASILIEKTDPEFHGAPQFIFSEFCRLYWANQPEINVGDDWGIPTLRFTKESYRPSRRLNKYMLTRPVAAPTVVVPVETQPAVQPVQPQPTSSNVVVRPARVSDANELIVIEHCAFDPYDAFNPRQIRDLIANPHATCRVVEVDGQVAGWCVALLRRHRLHRSGRVYNLAVDTRHRGKGLGKQLVTAVVESLAQQGVRHVYLEVRTDNTAAITLYTGLGFELIRHLPDYYGTAHHGQSMRLTIAAPVAVG